MVLVQLLVHEVRKSVTQVKKCEQIWLELLRTRRESQILHYMYSTRPVCIHFAVLPYTRVHPHLAQISGKCLIIYHYRAAASVLRVASTRMRWRCRPALSHMSACTLWRTYGELSFDDCPLLAYFHSRCVCCMFHPANWLSKFSNKCCCCTDTLFSMFSLNCWTMMC